MLVLTLTDCPLSLRGDLTRWLFEIDTNIYVGNQSARVREKIWERVTEYAKTGRAVMVYPAQNEQGFDFRVWGATWEPIDFDGLKLMLRPHPGGSRFTTGKLKHGFSKAAKRHAAKRFSGGRRATSFPDTYLVLDLETTGLAPQRDKIIEIGAIKVSNGKKKETFHSLIHIANEIPSSIEKLTGITDEILLKEGRELSTVINEFLAFLGDLPIVSHNISFDTSFLRAACTECALAMPTNSCLDTLSMARKLLDDPDDYKLATLLDYLGLEHKEAHRALGDCTATMLLYDKLCSIARGEDDSKVNENCSEG